MALLRSLVIPPCPAPVILAISVSLVRLVTDCRRLTAMRNVLGGYQADLSCFFQGCCVWGLRGDCSQPGQPCSKLVTSLWVSSSLDFGDPRLQTSFVLPADVFTWLRVR